MTEATKRPRILVARAMPPNVHARVVADYQASTNPDDHVFSREELMAKVAGHEGMIVTSSERIDAALIAALPAELRIIATFTVGHEHIDLAAATARGIVVTNTPDVLSEATAEIALLCLLGAARRAAEGQRLIAQRAWKRMSATALLGTQLTGKRLGIYGMGRIGRAVAQRARGFGLAIHYCNRTRLAPELEQGAHYHRDPHALLALSDFLSLNAPSTPETRGFLNAERIALLPRGAIVVNTARGDMVDDEALLAALRSEQVAAAGLDVFAGEPKHHPGYLELENVFLLPHLGSATHETRDAMGFLCLDNLDAFFAGRPCPTRLN
jgi:lactate dehydrogenase-like 2-hydroxyacid dehydrogenase